MAGTVQTRRPEAGMCAVCNAALNVALVCIHATHVHATESGVRQSEMKREKSGNSVSDF